ncbi:MAG: epoxyqueuosine reductase QueH [Thermoplasmata archaeon]
MLLLHICCAPCFTYVRKALRAQSIEFTGYFYNPNIHPLKEYLLRAETLKNFVSATGEKVIFNTDYPAREFIISSITLEQEGKIRCSACYEKRLRATAIAARERGCRTYSTTLLLSPYQKHELLVEIGNRIADEESVDFYYEDFRHGFRESIEIARAKNLYLQNYCGCIFSEFEKNQKKLKRFENVVREIEG